MTVQVARASNPAGTTAMWVRGRLDSLWNDEDFAVWYPPGGAVGYSLAHLETVSVLRFLSVCETTTRRSRTWPACT